VKNEQNIKVDGQEIKYILNDLLYCIILKAQHNRQIYDYENIWIFWWNIQNNSLHFKEKTFVTLQINLLSLLLKLMHPC